MHKELMNKQPENNMDNQTLPAVQNPLERPVIPRTEDYIVENFRMLIDYSGGCMCGAIYVKGIFIETHCHKSSCGLTCEYGGLHIGKDWDCMLDEKYIAEKLKPELEESWRCDINIHFLGIGRPTFCAV